MKALVPLRDSVGIVCRLTSGSSISPHLSLTLGANHIEHPKCFQLHCPYIEESQNIAVLNTDLSKGHFHITYIHGGRREQEKKDKNPRTMHHYISQEAKRGTKEKYNNFRDEIKAKLRRTSNIRGTASASE